MKAFLLIVVSALFALMANPVTAGNSDIANVANALRPAGDEAVEAFWRHWGDSGLSGQVFNGLEKMSGVPLISEQVDGIHLTVTWRGMTDGFAFSVGGEVVEDVQTHFVSGRACFTAVHGEDGNPLFAGYVDVIGGEFTLTLNSAHGEPTRWSLNPDRIETAAAPSQKKCRCFGSGTATECTDQECDDMTVECGGDTNAHRYCRWVMPSPFIPSSLEALDGDDAPL